jgi:CRP-like cAMP-binding protein
MAPHDSSPSARPAALAARLTGSLIATDLTEDERRELEQLGVPRRHPRGSYLILEGEGGDKVLLVCSGRLKIMRTDEEGREWVIAIRGPGELVGELNALSGVTRPRSASVVALDDVVVRSIRAADLVELIATRPNVSVAIMRQLAVRLMEATARQSDAARFDVLRRVARVLVEQTERFGRQDDAGTVRIQTGLTQHDLAGLVVASPTAVVRALGILRSNGVITTSRRSIVITDLAGLRRFTR